MAAMPLPMVSAESNTNGRSISGRQFIGALAEFAFAGHGTREGDVGNYDQCETNNDSPKSGLHEPPNDRHDEIHQTHWQHKFPGKAHELIHAQARERAANPNEKADQSQELEEEPGVTGNEIEKFKRRAPAAEEQRDGHAADREETEIFAEEKQREFESGIFEIVARDDFGFAFGQIEGRTVGFRGGGHEEEHEASKTPRREEIPMGNVVCENRLLFDNSHQRQRAGHHDDDE